MKNSLLLKSYVLENYAFCIFFIFSVLLCCIVLLMSHFLGGRSYGRFKNVPFESGIVSTGDTNIRFPVHFYLVGIFFLIFDIDALYIYAWSVCIYATGFLGFIEMFVFIFSLLVGLFYIVRIGALSWTYNKK